MAMESGSGSKGWEMPGSRKSSKLWVPLPANSITRMPAGTRCFNSGSTKVNRAEASVRMYETVSRVSLTLTGTGTTPARIAPRSTTTNSTRLREIMPIRSPRSMPAFLRPRAHASHIASRSLKRTRTGRSASRISMTAVRSDDACSAKSCPRLPGYPRGSGWGMLMVCLRLDNHFTENFACLQHTKTFGRTFQGQHFVDNGIHGALPDEFHQRPEIVIVKAIGPDDL